ncbi:MAG: response regulator [Verrucomicrobia bacterium]|nr:response regulator [Verrucomicrobiota bacterium]
MPKKILIADDEPHMLRVTELSLKKGGYDLVMARNGREAIEIARRDLPNLIVMDVLMPEVDGLTALKVLKEDPLTSGIPVIMFSARGQLVTRKDGQASGAALFITKPFSPTQLLNEARRLLGDGS